MVTTSRPYVAAKVEEEEDDDKLEDLDFVSLVCRMQQQWQWQQQEREVQVATVLTVATTSSSNNNNHHYPFFQDQQSQRLIRNAIRQADDILMRLSSQSSESLALGTNDHVFPPQQDDDASTSAGVGDGGNVLAQFERCEVRKGPLLGSGGFAHVYEVTALHLVPSSSSTSSNSHSYAPSVQAARNILLHQQQQQQQQDTGLSLAMKHLKGGRRRMAHYDYNNCCSPSCPSPPGIENAEKFANGIVDLAVEARIMNKVRRHPHILTIRAISTPGPTVLLNKLLLSEQHDDGDGGIATVDHNDGSILDEYFILVDKIYETLDERIDGWRHRRYLLDRNRNQRITTRTRRSSERPCSLLRPRQQQCQRQQRRRRRRSVLNFFAKRRRRHRDDVETDRLTLMLEQLSVAHDVASALAYLHDDHGIVHRDVKPSNIGWDGHGTCKLFDFGLATELQYHENEDSSSNNDDKEKDDLVDDDDIGREQQQQQQEQRRRRRRVVIPLTDNVGSTRYIAPEVSQARPCYDTSADVYSFAITLCEMLSPTRQAAHQIEVLVGRQQQDDDRKTTASDDDKVVDTSWPAPAIEVMLQKALSNDPSQRPTMAEINDILSNEISRLLLPTTAGTDVEQSVQEDNTNGSKSSFLAMSSSSTTRMTATTTSRRTSKSKPTNAKRTTSPTTITTTSTTTTTTAKHNTKRRSSSSFTKLVTASVEELLASAAASSSSTSFRAEDPEGASGNTCATVDTTTTSITTSDYDACVP